jgi:AraC family transcriptional regulator of adaptative response/methylated-DNA-[protein]-cysteine methyltransferase
LIIEDGALEGEDASVERFAERLGITARHLRRLFVQHWGATPSSVARTARVQRAKRLLTETNLSMTELAMQAGFRSLRRFNAVFSEVYKRPPSTIRRAPLVQKS